MLPLVDKPIIQYGVEEAMAAGCDQIIIVTGRGKTSIEDHFDVSYELEKMLEERGKTDLLAIVRQISDMIHVAYVRQKEAMGLGHAVLMARELVGNEPFAVLLADDVIDAQKPCLKQMMEVFEESQCSIIATQEVTDRQSLLTACWTRNGLKASSTDGLTTSTTWWRSPSRKKRPPTWLSSAAIFSLPRFETLERTPLGAGGELQLTDGIRGLLKAGENIYGYTFEGKRHDTGDKLGFLKATVEFALKRSDLGPAFADYLRSLKIEENAGKSEAA